MIYVTKISLVYPMSAYRQTHVVTGFQLFMWHRIIL